MCGCTTSSKRPLGHTNISIHRHGACSSRILIMQFSPDDLIKAALNISNSLHKVINRSHWRIVGIEKKQDKWHIFNVFFKHLNMQKNDNCLLKKHWTYTDSCFKLALNSAKNTLVNLYTDDHKIPRIIENKMILCGLLCTQVPVWSILILCLQTDSHEPSM